MANYMYDMDYDDSVNTKIYESKFNDEIVPENKEFLQPNERAEYFRNSNGCFYISETVKDILFK